MISLNEYVKNLYHKELKECSNRQIYDALLDMTQERAKEKVSNQGKKKVYYIWKTLVQQSNQPWNL